MASYTLNTTAAQEVIVTRARTEANAAGGTQYANNGLYLLAILTAKMLDIWHDQKQADKASFEDALLVATQEQKDAIAAVLGLGPGTLAPVKV